MRWLLRLCLQGQVAVAIEVAAEPAIADATADGLITLRGGSGIQTRVIIGIVAIVIVIAAIGRRLGRRSLATAATAQVWDAVTTAAAAVVVEPRHRR